MSINSAAATTQYLMKMNRIRRFTQFMYLAGAVFAAGLTTSSSTQSAELRTLTPQIYQQSPTAQQRPNPEIVCQNYYNQRLRYLDPTAQKKLKNQFSARASNKFKKGDFWNASYFGCLANRL